MAIIKILIGDKNFSFLFNFLKRHGKIPTLFYKLIKYINNFAICVGIKKFSRQKSTNPFIISSSTKNVLIVITLFFYFCIQCAFISTDALANNLSFSNGRLLNQDTSAETIVIEFDIAWDNSWRDSENYDAVWVFVKYSDDAGSTWKHATLKTAGTTPTGFSVGSGTAIEIIVPTDRKGCFIQHSRTNSGSVNTDDIQIVWSYGEDGVTDANASHSTNTKIKVFGVEMVYIPEGGFYVGDGSNGTYGEIQFGPSGSSKSGAISSEEALSFQNVSGTAAGLNQWYYSTDTTGDDVASGTTFQVGQPFPKGFKAFYLMKYEITQGEYANFLNTLTRDQQNNRVASDVSGDTITNTFVLSGSSSSQKRDQITAPGSGNGTTDPVTFTAVRPDRACNYLSWMDLLAFGDWAGLRPMTELEFEKACRGPLYPIDGEYPWLTTTLNGAQAGEIDPDSAEDGAETISDANANCCYNNVTFTTGDSGAGPLRVGIFAESDNTRIDSGSGYYGNMELAGNVWERCVTIGNTNGRGFAGTHGDGVLTTTSGDEGNATNNDWPGIDDAITKGVTGATGGGFRGGGWDETVTRYLEISNREFAGDDDATRRSDSGGRLTRTAP